MSEPAMSHEKIDGLCFWHDSLGPKYEEQYQRLRAKVRSLRQRGHRCRGIEIGDGNYSGCAYGDGAANGSLGDDVCPACNNTGEETQ